MCVHACEAALDWDWLILKRAYRERERRRQMQTQRNCLFSLFSVCNLYDKLPTCIRFFFSFAFISKLPIDRNYGHEQHTKLRLLLFLCFFLLYFRLAFPRLINFFRFNYSAVVMPLPLMLLMVMKVNGVTTIFRYHEASH